MAMAEAYIAETEISVAYTSNTCEPEWFIPEAPFWPNGSRMVWAQVSDFQWVIKELNEFN